MTPDPPALPKAAFPGMIPTMNNTGFMTEEMDAYSVEFTRYAGTVRGEVLDIGCAYGIATLAALANGARVCAADIEPRHLEVLRERVAEADRARLRTMVARMPGVDFPDASFDAVLAARVLHFLRPEEVEIIVAKMHRWLRQDGKVFLIGDSPYVGPWYTAAAEYAERKRRGERWPAFQENYAKFLPGNVDPAEHPKCINPLDPDVLARVVTEAGFTVERAEFLPGGRAGSAANTHAGVIARK